MSHATVTANVARALFDFAATRGHDAAALARRFGLDPARLAHLDARITVHVAQRLWAELPAILDDDDLGIHLAEHLAPQGALLPVLILSTAATLGEGLLRGMELQRVLGEGSTWRPAPAPAGRVIYAYDFVDPVAAAPRQALEFGLALMILVARRVVDEDLAYAGLRFRHGAPRNAARHAALFGCAPEYGYARDEIHLHAGDLGRPVRTANPALLEHLLAHGRTQVSALPTTDALADRARHAVRRDLARGPTLESVAASLGQSPRTLQRRLRDAGTSVQTLLDEARRARAMELVGDPAQELKAVAAALGFSEQAAFHRAFVRWTGVAPGRWRAARSSNNE